MFVLSVMSFILPLAAGKSGHGCIYCFLLSRPLCSSSSSSCISSSSSSSSSNQQQQPATTSSSSSSSNQQQQPAIAAAAAAAAAASSWSHGCRTQRIAKERTIHYTIDRKRACRVPSCHFTQNAYMQVCMHTE
jgi:hypothetical protein